MKRGQFLAVLAVIGVLGALVATRVQSGAETEPAAAPALESSASDDGAVAGQEAATAEAEAAPEPEEVIEPPPILDPKPALEGITGWLNTDATSLDDFDGQVRVVEFWTFGCFNCQNRIPHTQELYAEYKDCLLYTSPSPRDRG